MSDFPEWFSYDDDYLHFMKNSIIKIDPIRFLSEEGIISIRRRILEEMNGDCVPFCVDNQLDECICWMLVGNKKTIVRITFDSDRVEMLETYRNFWDVLHYIVNRARDFFVDD